MAGMFHLFTHAMFKALLFLGAGSIIHAVHSNDMKDMGGLRKYMPITHLTFLAACLAISGIPPFSGFFSKDEILVAASEHNTILFLIEYLTAGITAFYMFRLYFSIFWRDNGKEYHHAPHESPLVMTIPLIFLALASTFDGLIPFSKFVSADHMPFETQFHLGAAASSVAIGVIGIALAWLLYKKSSGVPKKITESLGGVYTVVLNKFYVDEVYLFVTKKIIFNYISRPVAWFDRHIVDGTMNGIGWLTMTTSKSLKELQSGRLQQYALVFVSGAIALALIILYWLSH